jgi:hypothetical protein
MRTPRAPSAFRLQDVTRAVRAVRAAGLSVGRVEVDRTTGRIAVIVADPAVEAPPLAPAAGDQNEWDEV